MVEMLCTRNRKSEATGNTNFDLNRRASLRPYREGGRVAASRDPVKRPTMGLDYLSDWAVGDPLSPWATRTECGRSNSLGARCK